MKTTQFKQSISVHVVTDHKPLKTGFNTIFIRVTIDRKKKEFNIKESWPVDFFDKMREQVSSRYSNDIEANRVNMVIKRG